MLCDGGDVEGGLHAALDLERGNASRAKGGEAAVEPQVAHREGQSFVSGGIRVGEAAAVGAAAAVAAAALF